MKKMFKSSMKMFFSMIQFGKKKIWSVIFSFVDGIEEQPYRLDWPL